MEVQRPLRMMALAVAAVTTFASALVVAAAPAQAGPVAVHREHSMFANFAVPSKTLGIQGEGQRGDVREYGTGVSYYSAFRVQDYPGSGHTIREYYSPGRCLDSNHAGAAYGLPCNGGMYQRWDFNHLGKQRDSYYKLEWDVYEIRNKATGRCLDANGDWGYTRPCNGGGWQRWFMNETNH